MRRQKCHKEVRMVVDTLILESWEDTVMDARWDLQDVGIQVTLKEYKAVDLQ